jgi:RimJ/RimL family protein N-acetyltransferase
VVSFAIREGTLADAAAMVEYVNALAAEGLDTITNRTLTVDEEEAFLEKAAQVERGFFLLAFDGERVIGMLDLWAGERAHNRHLGRIGISTARDWRRRGVGRALLQAAIEKARYWPGFCRIELEVAPWNEGAIALYRQLGFELEGLRKKGINLRGTPDDVLAMALTWEPRLSG